MSKATDGIYRQINDATAEAATYIQAEYAADTDEAKMKAAAAYDKSMAKVTKLETLLRHTKQEEAEPGPTLTVESLELRMMDAVESGDMPAYKRLREQRQDLVKRFGKGGAYVASSAYKSSYGSPNTTSRDIHERMAAAADAGDMALYSQLRAEFKAG